MTTTPSRTSLIDADWLHPGLHIAAMGSNRTGKSEIDPKALVIADLYVADNANQCEVSGEMEAALALGVWTKRAPVELGQVINGTAKGRTSVDAVTICDLTGTGAQDTAIASHVATILGGTGTTIEA